jgi:F0F1-type ATP synthase delta subunit
MSKRSNLSEYIVTSVEDNMSSTKLAKNVAEYLLDSRKASELESVLRDVVNLRAAKGFVEVDAYSTHKLSDSAIKDIKTTVKNHYDNTKTVVVNNLIDEDLVGGVKLYIGSDRLDLSIKNKLNKFRELTVK